MYIKTEFGAFEWDEAKNRFNIAKHGIAFEEAIQIFRTETYNYESTGRDYGEKREVSIGNLGGIIVTAVVHTARGQTKRIISARPADRDERKEFATFITSSH